MLDALDLTDLLADEVIQRRESGYDVTSLAGAVESALRRPGVGRHDLEELYDELDHAGRLPGWTYEEPDELGEILALASPTSKLGRPAEADYVDRVQAAWLGRCAGCNLGKPVEGHGWNRAKLRQYLELAGAYPLADYLPVLDPMPEGMELDPSWKVATRGRVQAMARDDDLDYTMLGLRILEQHGRRYSSADVGEAWLQAMPFAMVYTAERVAYRNLVLGLVPPATARFHNPYREWIGALIRGDIFGYVAPGDPLGAAGLAYEDAALSHVGNGIYGEMWAAALIAAAMACSSAKDALQAALSVVPPRSRLAEALAHTAQSHESGESWDETMSWIEERFAGYHWVHTINNAAVIAAALLWGGDDFGRTIGLAVEAGLDTDCTGATAGSAFGALHGRAALPSHWIDPLHDTIHSAIFGFEGSHISSLTERTVRLAGELAENG